MTLFEDWYITFWNIHHMDYEETFRRNDTGEYYHKEVFMSEKAFLAGQVLRDNNDNPTIPN